MTRLMIEDLHASVAGQEILSGLTLAVGSGEVHAVMGPNGSGKSTLSHVVMGKPGYEVTSGSIHLDDVDLLSLSTFERAHAGLFLAMQYPTEVPGVSLAEVLEEAAAAGGRSVTEVASSLVAEAERIGFGAEFLTRPLNVDLSGGEKKRNETLQLAVLQPKIAILDELDSGLDIDALRDVTRRVEDATNEWGLGVLAITHYSRLFTELKPDYVHILVDGRILTSGGPELADTIETDGYAAFGIDEAERERQRREAARPKRPDAEGPMGNPFESGFPDPFGDSLL